MVVVSMLKLEHPNHHSSTWTQINLNRHQPRCVMPSDAYTDHTPAPAEGRGEGRLGKIIRIVYHVSRVIWPEEVFPYFPMNNTRLFIILPRMTQNLPRASAYANPER